MKRFAHKTEVPVIQTKGELEHLLAKHGASHFGFVSSPDEVSIAFRANDRNIRFTVPMPDMEAAEFTVTSQGRRRSIDAAAALIDQRKRTIWRALLLCVKAKLESVATGIETFDEAFFAHVVMPGGKTVYESAREAVALHYAGNAAIPLLPPP